MTMLIGGTWQAAANGRTEDVTSPFDGTVTGTVVASAVVAGVDPRSSLSQDELFGPAVAVSSAEDVQSAIAQANGTPYGGLKASGIGKEGPRSAVAEMTDVKTVILHGRPW
jgi:acyl-CoA reductase-like NAD-dependent aldehyde dehydrogenase